jgi:uncharacterized membrane protein (DUF4010 family)
MSFLLLPVLPNRPVDPWGALNPAEIWLLAVLIAGLSFAGYVAVRTLGDEAGIAVIAVAGGLTSSTATTVSLARLAGEQPQATPLVAGGILVAGATMLVRVLAIAGALNSGLVAGLALPLIAAALVLAATSAVIFFRLHRPDAPRAALALKNPFELTMALKIAGLIALIMIGAKLLSDSFGARGVLLLAAASGVVDVDAVTLSMARLAGGGITLHSAATAILVAASVNTVAKAAMAAYLAGRKVGRIVGGASAVAIAVLGAVHTFAPLDAPT